MLVSSVYAIFLLAAIPSYHSNWKALNLRVGQGTMWIHITSGLLAKRKFPEFQHLSTRNTALRLHWHANKICYKELSLTSSLEYNSLDEHVLNILKNAFLFHSKTCNNQDVIKSINISMELICRLILTAITSGISIIKNKRCLGVCGTNGKSLSSAKQLRWVDNVGQNIFGMTPYKSTMSKSIILYISQIKTIIKIDLVKHSGYRTTYHFCVHYFFILKAKREFRAQSGKLTFWLLLLV